jgi:hypothetical protein
MASDGLFYGATAGATEARQDGVVLELSPNESQYSPPSAQELYLGPGSRILHLLALFRSIFGAIERSFCSAASARSRCSSAWGFTSSRSR